MKPLINCVETCFGKNCYNEINEYGYPSAWDMHPLMSTHISVFDPPVWNTKKSKVLNLLLVYRLITTSQQFKTHTDTLRTPDPDCFK